MVYIWVLRAPNWDDEEAAREALFPDMHAKAELWDATLSMTFARFRSRIAEIARRSLSAVEDATVAPWDEIPDGALVLPVDDDDWIAPDAASALAQEVTSGARACYWPVHRAELPVSLGHRWDLFKRRLRPGMPPTWLCASNSFAMLKHEDARPLLSSHIKASRWFEERVQAGDPEVRHVDAALSMVNRSLGSHTSLQKDRETISRSLLLRKLRGYRRLYERRLHPSYAWARPYVREMSALMAEVNVRK